MQLEEAKEFQLDPPESFALGSNLSCGSIFFFCHFKFSAVL